MKARNVTPEQMQVICNIQMLRDKIHGDYYAPLKSEDFKTLSHKTIEELRELQDRLIPEYNEAIRNNTSPVNIFK